MDYASIFDDVANKVRNEIYNGDYLCWDDMCVEHTLKDTLFSDYTIVVWGQTADNDDKFFSVSVHKNDMYGYPDENIFTLFSESIHFDELKTALFQALDKLSMIRTLEIGDFVNLQGKTWVIGSSNKDFKDSREELCYLLLPIEYKDPAKYEVLVSSGQLNRAGRWLSPLCFTACDPVEKTNSVSQQKKPLSQQIQAAAQRSVSEKKVNQEKSQVFDYSR